MAKVQVQNFVTCDAFWQHTDEKEESFTGVLIDVNEKATDRLSGNVRPLYLFVALCPKGEKSTFILKKEAVAIKAGQIVGVNSTGELKTKLGDHIGDMLGHEVTLTFLKKETFERDGKTLPVKRYNVVYDTDVHAGKHTIQGKEVRFSSYVNPGRKMTPVAARADEGAVTYG